MRFWDVIRADLHANTGQRRLRRAITAFLFNPGFAAIFLHRLALPLIRTPLDKLGMLIWAWNTRRCGCYFHLDSEIAPGLFLPHPIGVVIGQGVRVGPRATLYQSVTLGRAKGDAYPVLGADVTVYPNSVIIGPITIGDGAVVGAGSIVIRDVPAGTTVAGNPARILKTTGPVSSTPA